MSGWQPPSDQPSGWQPPEPPPPPPQQQPGAWPPTQAPWGPAPPTNGKATTSLVLGICGIVLCPLVLSIPALVLGYQSRREIDRSNGATGGRGMAVAGLVLGLLMLAFFVYAIAVHPDWLDDGNGFDVGPQDQVN